MPNKIIYNKLTTKKVEAFESALFSIKFTPNWRQVRKLRNNDILEFINIQEDIGLLQISSFKHSESSYEYDINKSIKELKENGFNSEVKTISSYQSLVYAINFKEDNLYQFRFEIGEKNKRVFITLTFENKNDKLINNNYEKAIKILNSIKIKD